MSLHKSIISIVLLILFICFYSERDLNEINTYYEEEKHIETNEFDGDILLEIDKINLYVYSYKKGNLKHGLQTYSSNKSIIILGHSGMGPNAYFKDLYKLSLNDLITVYYNGNKYNYEVSNITYFNKKESITIDDNDEFLYLITCDLKDYNKQFIVTSKKI